MAEFSWTFDSLQSAVQQELEEDDSEFVNYLETVAIPLAELTVVKDLNLRIFDKQVTGTLNSNLLTYTEAPFIGVRWFYILVSGVKTFLDERNEEFLIDYAPDDSDQGQPEFFAVINETQLMFAKYPGQAYTYVFKTKGRPDPLSDSNTTNWLSINTPNALFYQTCIKALEFFDDDTRLTTYAAQYANHLATDKRDSAGLSADS